MKKKSRVNWTILALLPHITYASATASPLICDTVKRSKEPSAYLVDKNGNLSKGPINYGRYAYVYEPRDTYTIPTDYRIVITPARIIIHPCSENCLELTKIKPICPESETYAVSYIQRDNPKGAYDRDWLPMKEHADIDFNYDDPRETYSINLKFHFKPVIEGEVYDATPKAKP